ncbi:MAG: outer membrane beta-barrel protein [Bacteroidia bacterium]
MKKIMALFLFACSLAVSAQDSTKTTKHKRKIYNEIGVNATSLLKQAFGSSSSIATQPYNLTYKLIVGKWAARVGLGITINNSNTINTSYNQNSYTPYPPDQILPNYNKTTSYYFRGGAEYRVRISRKLLVYGGIDIVGQSSNGKMQDNNVYGSISNNYDYRLTNSNTTSSGLGAGPVIGIQFYCTKRFSIYTEIPFYYMRTTQTIKTTQYENSLDNTGSYFIQNNSGSTHHTTTSAFSITIPATLYLAVKF